LFGNIILPAGAFTLSPPPGQFVVPPRQATKVGVSFAPTSSTNYTAQIEIDSNDPNQSQVNVALSGVGQAGILSAPGGVAFGVTRVSRSANRRMTLRNRGKGVLSGTIPFVAGGVFDFAAGSIHATPGTSVAGIGDLPNLSCPTGRFECAHRGQRPEPTATKCNCAVFRNRQVNDGIASYMSCA